MLQNNRSAVFGSFGSGPIMPNRYQLSLAAPNPSALSAVAPVFPMAFTGFLPYECRQSIRMEDGNLP